MFSTHIDGIFWCGKHNLCTRIPHNINCLTSSWTETNSFRVHRNAVIEKTKQIVTRMEPELCSDLVIKCVVVGNAHCSLLTSERGLKRSDHNVWAQPLLPILYLARSNSNEVMEISPDISFAIRIVINFTFCNDLSF